MVKKDTKELTALGRTNVLEDVSGLVSFLAGNDTDFTTAQVVDAGIIRTSDGGNSWSLL